MSPELATVSFRTESGVAENEQKFHPREIAENGRNSVLAGRPGARPATDIR
jgi:hypothetical protein